MRRLAASARRAVLAIAVSSCGALAGCSSEVARPVATSPSSRVAERARTRRPPAPAEWYWEAVDADVHEGDPRALDLPLAAASIARPEGASRLWDELSEPARDRLRRDGLVVLAPFAEDAGAPTRMRMGAFYTDLRERRIPMLLTLDALFAVAWLGITRALAAVEATELAPALDGFLAKIGARLEAPGGLGKVTADVAQPLRLARGVVAVADALARGTPPPIDLAPVVAQEIARIDAHAGVETSPLLGVPVDYARFAVPQGASRPASFRAATWLGAAPLVLAGRSELRGGAGDVTLARRHARAAMLLSRLVDRDVDAEVSDAYARVARLVAFVWGTPDDLSLVELGDLAEALKIDLAKTSSVASILRVDELRHRAALHRPPAVFDGGGGLSREGKPPVTVRILGGHASPDTRALGSLVTGELAKTRPLPALLDVAAWLGAPGVRTSLRESGQDAAPGYEDALARAVAQRPGEDDADRHGSVQGSLLDVLLHWAEAKESGPRSVATQRARIESLLAAWTLARHEGRPFTRPAPKNPTRPRELEVTGAALPVFVEPAPEAIAHLLSAVRQANRGLGALGRLDRESPHRTSLAEIEDLLGVALRAATRAHDDEPVAAADLPRLAAVPARLRALEAGLPDADLARTVEVATHPRTGRSLTAGVAGIEPALVLVKDTREGAPEGAAVLAVGAHLVLTEEKGAEPRGTSWLSTFRVTRGERAKP